MGFRSQRNCLGGTDYPRTAGYETGRQQCRHDLIGVVTNNSAIAKIPHTINCEYSVFYARSCLDRDGEDSHSVMPGS